MSSDGFSRLLEVWCMKCFMTSTKRSTVIHPDGVASPKVPAAAMLLTKRKRNRRYKTRPIYRNRKTRGFYNTTFLPMKTQETEQFFKYTRMSKQIFDELLNMVKPHLKRRRISDSINEEEKLAITLQYLSQGVSLQSLAWSYQMGLPTVHKIINNTCKVIWNVLSPIYLEEITEHKWRSISQQFFELWNFPNCIGALDGKHINIQAPPNSGSLYYNYKNNFSIVLLAACDANYIFTVVDIGAYGSQSDGGIFKASIFWQAMDANNLNIPPDNFIPPTKIKMPYVVVGDEAFPLKRFIMRPYRGRELTIKKRIFNYRLSRARRVIENAFGILAARWRVLKHNIQAHPDNVDVMVQAVVVLHNFCKIKSNNRQYCPVGYTDVGDEDNGGWRIDINNEPLQSVGRVSANYASRQNYDMRDQVADYFMTDVGSVAWQMDAIMQGTRTRPTD